MFIQECQTMKHITSCFSKQLIDICHRSFQSEKWKAIIIAYLPHPLNEHVYVGEFKQGELPLITDCPLWASQLRMQVPELRDYLRKEHHCYQFNNITVKIEPEFFKQI